MRSLVIVSLMVGLLACGNDNDPDSTVDTKPGSLEQRASVSECGGFKAAQSNEPTFGQTPSYCDAERLDWSYNDAAGELTLKNKRVVLNCCGEHGIEVTKQSDGSYLISETDAPQNDSRCNCMCVFDFEVAVKIPKGKIDIKLVREVTDNSDGEQELFSGQLDLSAGSGSEIVDASDAEPWCESVTDPDPAQQVSHTPEISQCGGFAASKSSDARTPSYCDAEVLDWSYDAETQQLKLADNRVQFNCCGDRAISVTKSADGAYTVTQTDSGERCRCDCVFDLITTIDGVTGNEITIQLMRQTIDAGAGMATILFDGTLDLATGSGTEILDSNPANWCN